MSDAKVSFEKLDHEPAAPGEEQQVWFSCPKHKRTCGALVLLGKTTLKHDPQGQNGGIAQWSWDGNREQPTLTPSVNCARCWHGYIRKGRCVDVNGADEPEPQ